MKNNCRVCEALEIFNKYNSVKELMHSEGHRYKICKDCIKKFKGIKIEQ